MPRIATQEAGGEVKKTETKKNTDKEHLNS